MTRCEVCNAVQDKKRCKVCRRNEYYLTAGIELARCITCYANTRTYANNECRPCLTLRGLRPCTKCGIVQLTYVSFHKRQTVCKVCRSAGSSMTYSQRAIDSALRKKYKLTLNEYTNWLTKQGNCCAICKMTGKLVVDYDQTMHTIRGLLCIRCNTGISQLQYSCKILSEAMEYLTRQA